MANEDAVKAAMTDPTKQSRIAKFLTTLSGQDFTPIINAINGGEQDFTAQLNQVQANATKISQLQAQVAQRDQAIAQNNANIQQLHQQISQLHQTAGDLLGGIPANPGNEQG